ncbi:MAG: hypothetical protein ABI254_05050 [Chthoniobacterales bacterium]
MKHYLLLLFLGFVLCGCAADDSVDGPVITAQKHEFMIEGSKAANESEASRQTLLTCANSALEHHYRFFVVWNEAGRDASVPYTHLLVSNGHGAELRQQPYYRVFCYETYPSDVPSDTILDAAKVKKKFGG